MINNQKPQSDIFERRLWRGYMHINHTKKGFFEMENVLKFQQIFEATFGRSITNINQICRWNCNPYKMKMVRVIRLAKGTRGQGGILLG